MKTKLFISYAWTSDQHRAWVRLLATQLRLLGYTVLIDEAVNYGESLSGFMQEVVNADHVLMIVDENYVERANTIPTSGVAIENDWISKEFAKKPTSWTAVLVVNNPERRFPAWLEAHRPKSFDFNSKPAQGRFPGIEQMNDLWRWIEGLPADKAHALSAAALLERVARIERIDVMRDPANYASPALKDRVTFQHGDHRNYTVGNGEYQFKISFSDHGHDSVYVYSDGDLKAVGLITDSNFDRNTVETFLRPGRSVTPVVGQSVVAMNLHGALCIVTIEAVQREVNSTVHIPSEVTFSYEILAER
jgi:hypothetical protein